MERTYTVERAAHARAVATANGRRVGRPTVVDPDKLAYAAHLRDRGTPIAEIVAKTGITRASLYRHLPPRPTPPQTAAAGEVAEQTVIELPEPDVQPAEPAPTLESELTAAPEVRLLGKRAHRGGELLESITWPAGYSPACPSCAHPTTGLEEQYARVRSHREPVIVALAQPCGCLVDEHVVDLQLGAPVS